MDKLLQACGATLVDYPLKTYCCGGSQKGTLPEVGVDLLNNLISTAKTAGADVIATVCPLCQFNLDVFQDEVATINKSDFRIPVVYFTQLMGLAFGVPPEKLGLQRGFVPIEPLLHEKELVSA
jgi:heterodisulfide reductase subunit B